MELHAKEHLKGPLLLLATRCWQKIGTESLVSKHVIVRTQRQRSRTSSIVK
jgi:hypothetical protein